ncbi:hypothetical protein KAT92_04370 [Candidatus Babeliales bacterium]|nr:hypothetical protein [Candidatus Babeliales bacterium]
MKKNKIIIPALTVALGLLVSPLIGVAADQHPQQFPQGEFSREQQQENDDIFLHISSSRMTSEGRQIFTITRWLSENHLSDDWPAFFQWARALAERDAIPEGYESVSITMPRFGENSQNLHRMLRAGISGNHSFARFGNDSLALQAPRSAIMRFFENAAIMMNE